MKHYEQNHFYMREKKNFHRHIQEEKESSLKRDYEKLVRNKVKYGKYPSLITEGENDRIEGDAPQILNDEERQISYSYGYFERGSRVLEGKFARGVFSEEEQRNFGIIDYIHNIPEKYLKNLKEYPNYLYGRIYAIGRSVYDFTLENGLSYEEYIFTMEIRYPEVKSEAFKDGYETRRIEISTLRENNKIKHK